MSHKRNSETDIEAELKLVSEYGLPKREFKRLFKISEDKAFDTITQSVGNEVGMINTVTIFTLSDEILTIILSCLLNEETDWLNVFLSCKTFYSVGIAIANVNKLIWNAMEK